MAKSKTTFFCQNCGAQHSKWMGQCSKCHAWNTIVEEVVSTTNTKTPWQNTSSSSPLKAAKAHRINTLQTDETQRYSTTDNELDRVLGGGVVPGSVTLVGGEPGIGKSTLMLQVALQLSMKCLYVSGEESEQQVKLRAERIGIKNEDCYLLTATKTQEIFQQIALTEPDFVIIDSVQTLHSELLDSAPGSVSQIRQCASEMIQFAKESTTPLILIGHITKDGQLAGPKILEHMVDTVLQFEGDRHHIYRILRAHKNRFGSTAEIGIYEMQGSGLREISNPSDILLSKRDSDLSGNAIASTLEGIRPMLIEIQALVSSAVYGTPQRSTTGFDTRRLNMLLAVLEKRCGFRLGAKDVFLNITGGIRVDDPAIDLAVVASILSSNEDMPLHPKTCFAAEVGLSGEIRPVSRIEQRISEAEKMGMEEIFISSHNKVKSGQYGIKVTLCGKIEEVFSHLFG
ncbi:MAG TPA: DNA repair protein RadA [Cryomorphaceae bacterium]|nr:DNA repair protein RadA [Owenweeksia sp.]MBG00544.1 DNA repair protein RadA [Owenweeksia sp.]HAD96158.1 DNA repair protein RadA [Cryomorphaceae bacterium]HBF20620.1 DNA repair protein RadA [Cryomorphaceae bacterium]HCQ15759.1 DNA repair protein RadA [Cryomorphaceae bacterium]|tara:strand:+ start:4422 stop:5789 length:1368 start_codon:yes stop_codon:yes gene_type:complete